MSNLGFEVLFHPEARLELAQAIEYYRAISALLSREFYEEFKLVIQDVTEFPESARQVSDIGVRRKQMSRFPYALFYVIDPDALYVVAVAHERRHPDYWKYRLEEPRR
jgi:toxin ParE1/3/4